MRFKLDENFGIRIKKIFKEADHDVETVIDENISGTDDKNIYEICCKENRCLLTLDLDFSDVFRFPPQNTCGIVILRASTNLTFEIIELLTNQFLTASKSEDLKGKLWIVEPGRVRVHQER